MRKLMIAAMIPLALLLTSCGEKKINPNDYLTITYDGASGGATAVASLDANKMVTDYPDAFRLGKDYKQSDLNKVVDQINQSTLGTLSKSEGISNGDEISFAWDKNALSALEGSYKIKWSGYKDIKATASGIPELEELNPFDYIDVSFKGESSKFTVSADPSRFWSKYAKLIDDVEKQSGMLRTINFDCKNPKQEYAAGEKLILQFRVYDRSSSKFNDEDVVELCKKSGYLITETEKEYTVE